MEEFLASRLGTIRFSAVLIPAFKISAAARGRAVWQRRLPICGAFPDFGCSRCRRTMRQPRVRQLPRLLPKITHRQARTALAPAQSFNASMVSPMEHSCSATSTAARVPIRLAAVK